MVKVGQERSLRPKGCSLRWPCLAAACGCNAACWNSGHGGASAGCAGPVRAGPRGQPPRNHGLFEFLKTRAAKTHEGKATFYKRADPLRNPWRARISELEEECTDVERGQETRTQQSAKTELPAPSRGLSGATSPGLPHLRRKPRQDPSGSLQDAAAARGATRLGRAAAARALHTDPGRPARLTSRSGRRPAQSGPRGAPPRSRPSPGGRQLRSALPAAKRKAFPSASTPPLGAGRQLRPGRCGHWPPAGLTFAEQRQQQQQPQPRGAGRRRRLRHGPRTPGPQQEGCWLGLGVSAAGCGGQPGRPMPARDAADTADTAGAERRGADSGCSTMLRAGIGSRD